MKNKNKFYLFAINFLFLTIFFVRVDGVLNVAKAQDCYSLCDGDSDPNCVGDCIQSNSGNASWGNEATVNGNTDVPCTSDTYYNYDTGKCYIPPSNLPYGSSCEWKATFNSCASGLVCGSREANGGSYSCMNPNEPWGMSGNTDPATATSCGNNFGTPECCAANQGFWYDSTCNTDPAATDTNGFSEKGCTDGGGYWYLSTCYTSKNDYCRQVEGAGYTWSTVRQKCTGDQSASCLSNSDCAIGINCVNGVCGGSASSQGVKTTAPTNINGTQYPAGTTIGKDGSVTPPAGSTLPTQPAGTIPVPSTGLSGDLNLCVNGTLAVVCRNASGDPVPGAPVVPLGGNGGLTPAGGLNGSTNGVSSVACGNNFSQIGGVCFPNGNVVNLPNPQGGIMQIVANLFRWLMGLFTTLAIIAFVVSGIQYFMAVGDEGMAETAKENAVHAIIGIIVGLSGFIIIQAISIALSGGSWFF